MLRTQMLWVSKITHRKLEKEFPVVNPYISRVQPTDSLLELRDGIRIH